MIPQSSSVTGGNEVQPWRTSPTKVTEAMPPRPEFTATMVAQLREAAQKQRKANTAVGTPSVALADLPTMAEIKNGNLAEKVAFVRRHFPAWLAYQQAHGLSLSKIQALVGVSSSVWHNHKIQYETQPERYGENGTLLGPKSKQLPAPASASGEGGDALLSHVLTDTAVAKVQAFMVLAQELRQMGAKVEASVSWQVDVKL